MKYDMYLRVKQVKERTGLSRATIYSMMKSGTFPMKTALGTRAVGWLESEISIWMAGRKTIEKIGLEAKPNPDGKRRRPAAASGIATVSVAEVPPPKSAGQIDGWENEPLPSQAEMDAVKSRLRILNEKVKMRNGGSHS